MDNRQRLRSRLFPRLRWCHHAGHSCTQPNSQSCTQPNSQSCTQPNSQSCTQPNSHTPLRFGGRLAKCQVSFIPKCLSGLNTRMLLNGQGSVENFSRNCWLEDNLHRFGQLPKGFESVIESEHEIVTVGDFSNNMVSQMRLATSQRVLRNNQLVNSVTVISNNSLLGDSLFVDLRPSSQTTGTISSSSNIPNLNLHHSGFAFDPDALAQDPPPYPELPDYPPPSYEESTLVAYYRRRASGTQTNNFLFNADCLY